MLHSHPRVYEVVLAVVVHSASPFSFPGRSRESRSVRLVHHRHDPTSSPGRSMSVSLLHFQWSKIESKSRHGNRDTGEVGVNKLLLSPWWRGLSQGMKRCKEMRWRASAPAMLERISKQRRLAPIRYPSGVSAAAQGSTEGTLLGPIQLSEYLALMPLVSVSAFTP